MTDARGSWQRAWNDTKKKKEKRKRKKKKEEMSKDREEGRSSRERRDIVLSLSSTGWNDEDRDIPAG